MRRQVGHPRAVWRDPEPPASPRTLRDRARLGAPSEVAHVKLALPAIADAAAAAAAASTAAHGGVGGGAVVPRGANTPARALAVRGDGDVRRAWSRSA